MPKSLATELDLDDATFLGVQVIGPCLIFTKLRDISREGSPQEMAKQIELAIAAWQQEKPSEN